MITGLPRTLPININILLLYGERYLRHEGNPAFYILVSCAIPRECLPHVTSNLLLCEGRVDGVLVSGSGSVVGSGFWFLGVGSWSVLMSVLMSP